MSEGRRRVRTLVAGVLPAIEIGVLVLLGAGLPFYVGLVLLMIGEGWLVWGESEPAMPQFNLPLRPILAREYLGLMIRAWFRLRPEHYRANVMLWNPDWQILEMWASYGMDNGPVEELGLTLYAGQGCAGQAFAHHRVVFVDLSVHRHESFGVNPLHVWPGMLSILSVPILRGQEIVGVLSIDSDLPLRESGFADPELFGDVSKYASMIFGGATDA